MSVRVNLLPEATKQRDRVGRQRLLAGLAGVLLLIVLGGVYWFFASQLRDAENELERAQARTAELRGERAELVAFEDLANRRELSDEVLRAAMGDEVSLAGLLQDVAFVMPSDAQIDTLTFTVVGIDPEVEDPSAPLGSLNLVGRSLTSHAPGVETVLISLEKVTSFSDLYLNSTTLTEVEGTDERIVTFSVDGQIARDGLTRRYEDGLPEVQP